MPLFVTIGYGDESGYRRTAPAVRDAAHAHDEQLRRRGAVMGAAGAPSQVRNHDGAGVRVDAGPFMNSPLPLAGFALIEAADMNEALQLVQSSPCAVAQGVVGSGRSNSPPDRSYVNPRPGARTAPT